MITDQQRLNSTKADTYASTKRAGMHRKHNMSHPFLKELKRHFISMEGGQRTNRDANSRASVISRYLHHANKKKLEPTLITDAQKISNYMNALKTKTTTAASTMKNILNCLKAAHSYLSDTDVERIHSKNVVKKRIKLLKESLNKEHTRRKSYMKTNRLLEDASIPDLVNAPRKIRAYAPKVNDLLNNYDDITVQEQNEATSYLTAAVAIENAARSSHVTNLTMLEFHSGKHVGNEYICLCSYGKSGIAPVTFSAELFAMTNRYIRTVRTIINGASSAGSAPVFVNTKGQKMSNFSSDRHLYRILKLAGVQNLFNLTQLRKAVTTYAVRNFSDSPGNVRLVHQYLCHEVEVANMYYSAVNTHTDYHQGYLLVQQIYRR